MKVFAELGAMLEQRWRDLNYSEEDFPALAEQALREAVLHEHVDAWDTIRWVLRTTEIPQQQDVPANFGNPPITLYSGSRFHIDIYFWLDGTTSIHQHAFCGAFQVLMGSSIHSHYSFHLQQKLNDHFAIGDVVLEKVELLLRGRIQRILPGKQYIHSLFHLDRPSATVCVRTYHTAIETPQYNCLKPYFASNPFFQNPFASKQLQSVSLLLQTPHLQALEMIDDLLARADFPLTFQILDMAWGFYKNNALENTFGLSTGREQYARLFETARRRHGQLVDLIPPVFAEAQRQNNLTYRRGQITSPDHRFFLALLLNVPDRQRLLEMVRQRVSSADPIETVLEWVEQLANTKMLGSHEPNVLGLKEFDEDYLFALRCLLENQSLTIAKKRYALELAEECSEELLNNIERLYRQISESDLFKSLFSDISIIDKSKDIVVPSISATEQEVALEAIQ